MDTSKTAKNLKLSLVGLDPPVAISDFDNYSGLLMTPVDTYGIREAAILTEDNKVLWSGIVKIETDGSFDLCVSPTASSATEEVISWKDLPPFFTVFDGGYESLSQNNVNILLDDLISFHDLVKVRCHFELNGKQQSITGKWGDQENLKTLSAILVDWSFSERLIPQQLVLLEIELFETVYFVIGINEESDELGVVLSLTSHFYQQRNRVGRRIPIEPVEIDGLKILEVSDFGMKVSAFNSTIEEKDEILITINNYSVSFGVTYRRKISAEKTQLGLYIQDHSPEARKAWQGFLLRHQYALLNYRTQKDYEDIWSLYKESGYLSGEVEVIEKTCHDSINSEWQNVDRNGPSSGATVIGYSENKPVATIGVAKALGGLWVAQSAAVLDKPENLKFTREMYSWRTRFILQQVDSKYHLAFFLKNKPFLDRFFRKFYLLREDSKKDEIVWEEWRYYSVIKNKDGQQTRFVSDPIEISPITRSGTLETSNFIKVLKENLREEVKTVESKSFFILNARPFIHIAQYFNVSFISNTCDLADIDKIFADLPAYTIFTSAPLSGEQLDVLDNKSNKIFGGHEEVTWACPKSQLPEFLQNSLRSLEIMVRKYSTKKVA